MSLVNNVLQIYAIFLVNSQMQWKINIGQIV